MRKAFLICSLVLLSARIDAGEFLVNDGKLVWQGIFETNLEIGDLEKILVNTGMFTDIINTGDRITFWCKRAHLDPRDFGYSTGATPIYVSGNDISFFCTIQVKDGRYRATVDQFILTNNVTGGLLREGNTERIETYAVNGGDRLKSSFMKRPAELYDKFLTKLLTIKEAAYLSNEW